MMLWRASLRYLVRHPWHLGLSVLGVALGVAVVVAIDLASESARRAFDLSAQALSGQTTYQVISGPNGIPEEIYRGLRLHGIRVAAPVVEAYATTPRAPGQALQILGIDPFADPEVRPGFATGDTAMRRLLIEPGTVLLAPDAAHRLGVRDNERLELDVAGHRRQVMVVGMLQGADSTLAPLDNVLITDIATAQELLGIPGRLTRIDLRISDDQSGEALLQRIRTLLPAGTVINTTANRSSAFEQMTHAFRLNLVALGLLVLVVGMFLIYNTMTFSVVQRRGYIGALRAIGVTRREIFRLILGEALLIGLAGTFIGLGLGTLLGTGLVRLVTRTINDLYFVLAVRELTLAPLSLLKGIALGVGATALTALVPAWEATRAPPSTVLRRSALESKTRRFVPWAALSGLLFFALAALLLALPTRQLVVSYGALFCVMVGFALLAPLATILLMRALGPMAAYGGLLGRMAARGVIASLSRTGIAVAALAIAVAATIGVGTMITSFRHTFSDWVQNTFRADVYVSAPALNTGPPVVALDPDVVARLEQTSGIATVSTGRRVTVASPGGNTEIFAIGTTRAHFRNFQFKEGKPDTIWPAFAHGDAVIVSEPYAYRHQLHPGDRLQLPTDIGMHSFTVGGIYYDYGSEQGVVGMSRATYERLWHDHGVSSLGIYARPGVDIEVLISDLRARAGTDQALVIRSNRGLRETSLAIFDRTFAITAVLRLLAGAVAFVGVLSALMALQLERARELAVLRANGLTPMQLWGLVTGETSLMGLAAGLLALPLGLVLALLLIVVINQRSFGWSMHITIDPAILAQGLLLAIVAALLAGLYPAFKMARTSPALALREE
jgi:putative ABC transport system permease protein